MGHEEESKEKEGFQEEKKREVPVAPVEKAEEKIEIKRIEKIIPSLEDVFIHLIAEEDTRVLTISGSISPMHSGESVSIYITSSRKGASYDSYKAATDDFGRYAMTWNFTSEGTYYIIASWSGTSNYTGADSETCIVFVGPDKSASCMIGRRAVRRTTSSM
jgi:hypothetical protein